MHSFQQEGLYDVPFLHMNSRRFLSGSSFCLRPVFKFADFFATIYHAAKLARDLYTRLMESPAQVPEARIERLAGAFLPFLFLCDACIWSRKTC